jgi:hypothetical protein
MILKVLGIWLVLDGLVSILYFERQRNKIREQLRLLRLWDNTWDGRHHIGKIVFSNTDIENLGRIVRILIGIALILFG